MNNIQLKHFRTLLAKKRTKLLSAFYYDKEESKPKEVLEAELLIQTWKDRDRAKRDATYFQIEEAIADLETKCIFGAESQEILDALNSLDDWSPTA